LKKKIPTYAQFTILASYAYSGSKLKSLRKSCQKRGKAILSSTDGAQQAIAYHIISLGLQGIFCVFRKISYFFKGLTCITL